MSRMSWFLGAAIVLVTACAVHDMVSDPNAESTVKKSDAVPTIASSQIENSELDNVNGAQVADSSTASVISNPAITPDVITLWVTATHDDDSAAQKATDDALASAPREIVLPVLQKIMANGSESDRQSALSTLHRLALKQGDADGEIKNILRLTSYDGDDVFATDAQLALEDVERSTEPKTLIQSQPQY